MLRWLRYVAVLVVVLAGARWVAARASVPPDLPSQPMAGRYRIELESGGHPRLADVHVPQGYDAASPPPLVIALHGAGGGGGRLIDDNGWAAKGDAEGFLVVAPYGLPAAPKMPSSFLANPALWNSGQLRPQGARAQIDDVAFVRELLDTLAQRAPYDATRVYVTGHSNGGGMTFRLAAELGERIAAIGTVAGMVAVEDPRPAHPMPTLYIYGTADPVLPREGGEVSSPWGSRTTPPVAEMLAKWARANGCSAEPQTLSETPTTQRVVYAAGPGGAPFEALYLIGHGHNWPGAKSPLPERVVGPNTSQLNATDTLWEFFRQHRLSTAP